MAFDLLIRNGTIIDGSGALRYRADVGVTDGRIVEIGRIRRDRKSTRLNSSHIQKSRMPSSA